MVMIWCIQFCNQLLLGSFSSFGSEFSRCENFLYIELFLISDDIYKNNNLNLERIVLLLDFCHMADGILSDILKRNG